MKKLIGLVAGLGILWAITNTWAQPAQDKTPPALILPAASADKAAPADANDKQPVAPAGATVPAELKPMTTALPEPKPMTVAAPEADKTKTASVKDIAIDPDAGATNDNPTGRQEPSVSVEWIGPATAKVGQAVSYQLMVRNIGGCRAHQVVVHDRMPPGVVVNATEPKAETEDNLLVWNLGTMEPRQEKRIDIQLVPGGTGKVDCQAFVTFTGLAVARLEVHQPKLTLKVQAPKNVVAGDPATVAINVCNPGDAVTENVKVKAMLTEGLEHAQGKEVSFDLGNLAPNESRNVFVLCGAKTAGEQKCEAEVTADPKLTAHESATVDVLAPKINLAAAGPGMRYLDRHAVLVFKVSNPGTAPAHHVNIIDRVPVGFKVVAASHGGQHDFVARTVSWYIGELAPEQSKEVTLEVVAASTGEHRSQVLATAARGLESRAEITTRIEGLPALLMELVDLDDPLEVGAETAYEIRVTNTGTKTETNLQLTCTVPDKMEFRGALAPAGCSFKTEGQEVVFQPLPKLAPRADAIFRVKVKGAAPGDLRFQARMKADGLSVPVLKEESTKVYGDEAVPLTPVPKKDGE
jgi:uncharacterized repeat protein (TIGR01451 family)